MCGVVGYVGDRQVVPILVEGLRMLEYRGYDSAGVAVEASPSPRVVRASGKLKALEERLVAEPAPGTVGIGHTRWATHGKPTDENAHPHTSGTVSVVHNGIIENHLPLREELEALGQRFQSETDTEILAHLIDLAVQSGVSLTEAVRQSLQRVEGAYAVACIDSSHPGVIVAAKVASPMVVGLGEGEQFIASDIPALLAHTREIIFLDDGEMVTLTRDSVTVETLAGEPVNRPAKTVPWSLQEAEKGGYKHFMLKEIHEQGRAVSDTLAGRFSLERAQVFLDEVSITPEQAAKISRIYVLACGTSWHAGLVGRLLIEQFARIPTEVDLAHEFRYRNPIVDESTLVLGISQSGETADTLASLKEAKRRGARVVSIVNVMDASIARMSDDVIYTHAGIEIGVASTKAFTSQLAALSLLAVHLGRQVGAMDADAARTTLTALAAVPAMMEKVIEATDGQALALAHKYLKAKNFLFLGRGMNFPIALEGALKLKEISYIHAEGYAAGEMKHGPIALIDESMPVVVVATQGSHYDKIMGNLQEAKARDGKVIAIGTEGDDRIGQLADDVILIPDVDNAFQPLLTVLPLQLFAYHVANLLGTDVDQPRNLAKSVTVE